MKQMILHTEIPGMLVIPTIGDGFSGSKFGGDLKECADYYNDDRDQPWISRGKLMYLTEAVILKEDFVYFAGSSL